MNNSIETNEDDFAALYENSFSDFESMEPGQSIETEIVSIAGDCIFLQLGGKSEGQLDTAELTDKDGNITVKEGDKIKVYF
ncbi:MAG: S1 RNA-binding domain-containing protein, partial [Spirochaetaceae bacterium]|nr:S1 RNA-binding domain-containing protein [Spirochaetaceae bacterium]